MKNYTVNLGKGNTFRSYNIQANTPQEAIQQAKDRAESKEGIKLYAISVWEY